MTTISRSDAPGEFISPQQEAREQELVDRVVASYADAKDERHRQLLGSLTRHMHAFLREVRLTEDEWRQAIEFLTAVGHITDERRQEFILLSDVLGVSMQTVAINNEVDGEATEATVFGPFFVEGAPRIEIGGDMAIGVSGEPCWVEGTVSDTDGKPVPGARVEVWEADSGGHYDVQYDDDRVAGRAHLFADDDGRYAFWAVTPTSYPIANDGPVGSLLATAGRSSMRPAHLHFMVTSKGEDARRHRDLVTHIFVEGDEVLAQDAVFGDRKSLVKKFSRYPVDTPAPDGRLIDSPTWSRVRFDIVLALVTD